MQRLVGIEVTAIKRVMKDQVDSCRGEEMLVYVGTYTGGASEGIYVYRMDSASGALELASMPPLAE